MQSLFIQYVYLIVIILALVMLTNKLRLAYPIVLVLGVLILSLTSVFSHVTIDSELVFLIFLPPLLYKAPFIVGWVGMRGVVSLAAALSVPVMMQATQPFPYRNLILFITFIVILVTLVFQGLTLPQIIRKIKPEDRYASIPEHIQEIIIQKKIAETSLHYLQEKYGKERVQNEHLDNLLVSLQIDLNFFQQDFDELHNATKNSLSGLQRIYLDLLDQQ